MPDPDYAHGSYHWSFERIVSAGLIPLTVAPFAAGSLNPVTDSVLCALLVVHSHIGFEYVYGFLSVGCEDGGRDWGWG